MRGLHGARKGCAADGRLRPCAADRALAENLLMASAMPAADAHARQTVSKARKPLVMRHWMTASPHSIGRDQPLAKAHRIMLEHDLRHLPVLERGKIVGILTQRDLYFVETIAAVDPETECVDEAMSPDVYCVSPSSKVQEVVTEMAKHKYGCAIVLEDSKVVGLFTTTDALRMLADLLAEKP